MQLWNRKKFSVFPNAWRRSRVILIEKYFKSNCNKKRVQSIQWRFERDDSWNLQCRVDRVLRNNSKCAMHRMLSVFGIKELSVALLEISWLKVNPTNNFTNGDCMFSQSRATSAQRFDFVVIDTAKLRHRKRISSSTTRRRDVSHDILMEFTIVSNEIQYIVIRNSKLFGPRGSVSRWINWHRKIAHRPMSLRDIMKLNKSCGNATMKIPSDFWEALTNVHPVHRESGEERSEPIPFYQYQRWHSFSSTSIPWWSWNENWWRS